MSNLVIVAIPDENDHVWKISSEKVPHLTLLFLGDIAQVSNPNKIVDFVEHAANTTLKRFYLSVDRRGELGADQADVLFFKKSYECRAIRDFRAALLKDNNIRTAYDSTTQREGPWIPHLTLGYPATPAKPDDRDYGIYSVEFTKISVWVNDYDGPEWVLKDYWDEYDTLDAVPMDVAMSDIQHHGVKGQRWGVRKVEGSSDKAHIRINQKTGKATVSKQALTAVLVPALVMPPLTPLAFLSPRVRAEVKAARAVNKGVKADKKWQKQLNSSQKAVEVHNKASEEINAKIPDFNKDKRWKNADGTDIHLPSNPAKQKEYDKAVSDELLNPAYSRAAIAVHGSQSPGGRYKFDIVDSTQGTVKVTDTLKVQHADGDKLEAHLRILRDENGHILGFESEDTTTEITQTIDLGIDFLEHHGVKGQKWGVRNDRKGRDRFSPQGYSVKGDAARALLIPLPASVPSIVRLGKRANQGTKAYLEKRKSPEEVAKRAQRKLARRDFYWEAHAYSDISHADVHNKVADEIDSKVYKLQTAPKYRGKNLKTDKKLQDEYDQDVAKVTDAAYRRSVNDTFGTNPSGTKTARYVNDVRGSRIEIRDVSTGKTLHEKSLNPIEQDIADTLGHAATNSFDGPDIMMTVKTDSLGFITQIGRAKLPEDEGDAMAQTTTLGEEFLAHHGLTSDVGAEFILEHFGVKGMRWGRRTSPPEAVTPTASSHVPQGTRRKTKIKTEGGENHPAHDDAIKVAEARVKLKRSGTSALSNKELRDVANRIQLENQVKLLTTSRGKKFVSSKFQSETERLALEGARRGVSSAAPSVSRRIRRGAAVAATTAAIA